MIKRDLNEVFWNKIGQQSFITELCLLFFLVIAFINYWLILDPSFFQYRKLLNEAKNLQVELAAKQKRNHLVAYQNQVEILNKDYQKRLQQLSVIHEIPKLLSNISKAGLDSGLVMEFFSPKTEEKHDFLVETTINMTVIGEYQQLILFLSRVMQFNRLIGFQELKITKLIINKQKNNALRWSRLLRLETKAKIYQYNSKFARTI